MLKLFNSWHAVVAVALFGAGCGSPNINSLDPSSGIPHTLVLAQGNSLLASLIWDNTDTLASPFLGASLFNVPHNAAPGAHPVKFSRNGRESSTSIDFTVLDPGSFVFPVPKLTYIQTYFLKQNAAADSVTFWLFTQGPNIDLGAAMEVNGTMQSETYAFKAKKHNLNGIDFTTLGYPVFHTTMIYSKMTAKIGESLNVRLINDGGALSNVAAYTVADSTNWDSDGDGLLDSWEKLGYDANGDGTIDTDLPGMGADPYFYDIFVEVDFMDGKTAANADKIPVNTCWPEIINAFWNAPIMNIGQGKNSGQGIFLHADYGQSDQLLADGTNMAMPPSEIKGGTLLPFEDYVRMDNADCPFAGPGETTASFYDLKNNNLVLAPATENFNAMKRGPIFHYLIFANKHGHTSGSTGRGEIHGNDAFITMTDANLLNRGKVVGTFIHEFGHNLGLGHGGASNDGEASKPNHNSVMCYLYQLGGTDTNCDRTTDGVYTYSSGMRADINEASADENKGMCDNLAVDWNANGNLESAINFDISASGGISIIKDFDSWGNIRFDFKNSVEYND
jgi:hypothetical protein